MSKLRLGSLIVMTASSRPLIASAGTDFRKPTVRAMRLCRSAKLASSSALAARAFPCRRRPRLARAEPCRAEFGGVAGALHLIDQRMHVRDQPGQEQFLVRDALLVG